MKALWIKISPFICITLCILIALSFKSISQSVEKSINLCIEIVLPALFPFFVISDLLMSVISINPYGKFARIYEKIFRLPSCTIPSFIIGIISGYPVGASSVKELYKSNAITKSQSERLICFTNNSGPLFIICSVGCGMLKSLNAGVILYIIHVTTAVLTGIVLGIGKNINGGKYIYKKKEYNFSLSVEKSFMQCIKIMGYVIFFGIVTDLINKLNKCFINSSLYDIKNIFFSVIYSIIEITNGIKFASDNISEHLALCIASFAATWSGISVYLQTVSVTENLFSLKKYIICKFFGGCMSALLCHITFSLINTDFISNIKVWNLIYPLSLISIYLIYFKYIIERRKKKNYNNNIM